MKKIKQEDKPIECLKRLGDMIAEDNGAYEKDKHDLMHKLADMIMCEHTEKEFWEEYEKIRKMVLEKYKIIM